MTFFNQKEYDMKIQVFCNIPDFNDKDLDKRNCYNSHHQYVKNDNCLGESSFNIENFKKFIEIARKETLKGDSRPIYVFNFFERLDEAIDIAPFIDLLASLGRQVFIGVGNYPIERFKKYRKVQIV